MAKNKETEAKEVKEVKEAKEVKAVKEAKSEPAIPKDYTPRLKSAYKEKVLPALVKELELTSPMAAPKLDKIVIGIGVSEAKENIAALDQAKADLALISGQSPQIRRAKKSISNFKLRQGMPIGLRVTLRGGRMYEFLDRFISIACPRIRDFQGFDAGCFDGRGNLNLGLKEHHIFPEVDVEKSPKARGMNITFATTATDNKSGKLLLVMLGLPFRKAGGKN
ncbi:MAG: 50S ribosomal protein L5 [Elusimicrobia bacterium]|nr:50S ribosomal protein L5 [Elusimicrobiota bacterium]